MFLELQLCEKGLLYLTMLNHLTAILNQSIAIMIFYTHMLEL